MEHHDPVDHAGDRHPLHPARRRHPGGERAFDQILNLYNPAVYEVSDIIDTYVYRVGLEELNFSLAAAAGLFKNVIGLILVVIVNRIAKAVGDYGVW